MNEPMPKDVDTSVTGHNYPGSMEHQALSQFGHQTSDDQVQLQPATQGAYVMQTWNPYMSCPTLHTIAPGSLDLSDDTGALTSRESVWPLSVDGAGTPWNGLQAYGVGSEASTMGAPAGDNYQLCGHYPEPQSYPIQALNSAPVFPSSSWFPYGGQKLAVNARQPWGSVPETGDYQQAPSNIHETMQAHSRPMPGEKRNKTHVEDNRAESQPPLPKKRSQPRKIKTGNPTPIVPAPTDPGAQNMQPSQSSSTFASWTSQSSPTLYQPLSADGSMYSPNHELKPCDVMVKQVQQHTSLCWSHVERYHAPPQSNETPTLIRSGSSIPPCSSPDVPGRTTSAFPLPALHQQQPKRVRQEQQEQREQQQLPAYPVAPQQASFCSDSPSISGGSGGYPSQSAPGPLRQMMNFQHCPIPTRQPSVSARSTACDLQPLRGRALPRDQKSRNRVAATKCRLKTKAATTALEEEEKVESDRNYVLSDTMARLREEYFTLRNQLLMHRDCKCTLIHQYLEKQARSLAETGSCYVSGAKARKDSSTGNEIAVEDGHGNEGGSDDAEGEEWDAQTMVEAKKEDEAPGQIDGRVLPVENRRRVERPKKGVILASAPSPAVAASPPSSPPAATAVGNLVQVREKVARRRLKKGTTLVAGITREHGPRVAGLVQ